MSAELRSAWVRRLAVGLASPRGDLRGTLQPQIPRKHPVIPVPVLPWRRDEIGEPVEKLKRRELDDAVGTGPRGRSRAARADPGGRLVSGQHVADLGDLAVCAAAHREPLEREGWPGGIPQQVLETLERDS